MATRTFLALDIDEPTRDGLIAATREFPPAESKVRWVARENLHVTLKFLGDLDDAGVRDVCHSVAALAEGLGAFEFEVTGLKCIGSGGRPRMFWAEVEDPSGQLAAMFHELEEALAVLGFPQEHRAFRPHVTLGRIKSTRNAGALREVALRYADEPFGAQWAEGIVVYGSELTPRGPIYTPLEKGAFGPG